MYKANPEDHLPTQDPPPAKTAKARLDCQMCSHRAKQAGARSQVKAVIMCSGCSHLVCGPKCWCELHGIPHD